MRTLAVALLVLVIAGSCRNHTEAAPETMMACVDETGTAWTVQVAS